jgi:SAM-dependent methyltransferase
MVSLLFISEQMKNVTYIHVSTVHNSEAPQEIVPVLMELLAPESVVDIGCGIGTFLKCFKQHGIKDVLGIDGPWVNMDLLHTNISPQEFKEQNLEQSFKLEKKYDLVVSVEVAEHIHPEYADVFIQNLISAGNVIFFSAAVPQQGGQNHVNEQWLSYWKEKFSEYDYEVHDVLKPYFWNNPKIFFWYKQNMVLVAPKGYRFRKEFQYNTLEDVIHKDMFQFRMDQMEQEIVEFRNGQLPVFTYFKYLLNGIFTRKQKN